MSSNPLAPERHQVGWWLGALGLRLAYSKFSTIRTATARRRYGLRKLANVELEVDGRYHEDSLYHLG